jgi:hypothetical protein
LTMLFPRVDLLKSRRVQRNGYVAIVVD